MLQAIETGNGKLKKYYGKTWDKQELLYNLGTVLNPRIKLSLYGDNAWGFYYYESYRLEFIKYYREFYKYREELGAIFKRL